jgi:FkbM family methyltransferase
MFSSTARLLDLLSYYRGSVLPRYPWAHAALRRGAAGFVRTVGSLRDLHLPEHPFVEQSLEMLAGDYEPDTCRMITEALRPGGVAVDVGANIGYMTRVMAAAVGSAGRVFGFEPNPQLFPLAVRNNARSPQVWLFPLGLSDHSGVSELHVSPDSMATGSLHPSYAKLSASSRDPRVQQLRVQLAHGSTFLRDLGVRRADFLKVDVEGHEVQVLEGLSELIAESASIVILVELWPPAQAAAGHSGTALFDWLDGHGLAVAAPTATGTTPLPDRAAYAAYARTLRHEVMLRCVKR